MKNRSRNPIGKAMQVLVSLIESEQPAVGVRELATALDMSPSNAHRILNELADGGFVTRDAGGQRYALGVEFFRIAQICANKLPVKEAGLTAMRRLVERCNETALLALYNHDRQEMLFAASVESTHSLRYVVELNKWIPVHTGASGLAILAFLPEQEIEAIVERTKLTPSTSRSITDRNTLASELDRIRLQGFALTRGQRIAGAVGLAVPLFDSHGAVMGNVCLTIPEMRFDQFSVDALLPPLSECVREIAAKIGGSTRASPHR